MSTAEPARVTAALVDDNRARQANAPAELAAMIGPSLTNEPPDDGAPHSADTAEGEPLATRLERNAYLVALLDVDELLDGEAREAEWLAEPFLARGRSHSLTARAKAGKSLLTLYVVGCLCVGRDPFTGDKREPVHVLYVDHEMTEDDVHERLDEFGFSEPGHRAALRAHFHYALLPASRPLDTPHGGDELGEAVDATGAELVILDTFGRVTVGEENSNDTTQDFYAYTGQQLKRRGVTVLRLDHMGKDPTKGARGGSAKGDDVDVAWNLEPTDKGLRLTTPNRARVSWIPEAVNLAKHAEPLRWEVVEDSWPAGTAKTAGDLDTAGVALTAGKGPARKELKAAGLDSPSNETLLAAQRWRRSCARKAEQGEAGEALT